MAVIQTSVDMFGKWFSPVRFTRTKVPKYLCAAGMHGFQLLMSVKVWHAWLLAIIVMGQSTGVYKKWREVPLWSNIIQRPQEECVEGEGLPPGLAGTDDEGDEQAAEGPKELKAAEDAVCAAEKAAEKAGAKADHEDKGPVKEKGHQSAEMRIVYRECKNTLFVVGPIFGMDGVLQKVKMIVAMLRLVWTSQSSEARECRSASDCKAYYVQ